MSSDIALSEERQRAYDVVVNNLKNIDSSGFSNAERNGTIQEYIKPHLDTYLASIVSHHGDSSFKIPKTMTKDVKHIQPPILKTSNDNESLISKDDDDIFIDDESDEHSMQSLQSFGSAVMERKLMKKRMSQYRGSAMEAGSHVWVKQSPDRDWEKAMIISLELQEKKTRRHSVTNAPPTVQQTLFKLYIEDFNGNITGTSEVLTVAVDGSREEYESVKLRNDIDDEDDEVVEKIDDLITLSYLHEAAILFTLRRRFERNLIYTNTGPILIAVVCVCNANNDY